MDAQVLESHGSVTASCSLCAIVCNEMFTDRHRCPDVLCIVVMLMGYVVNGNCMSMNFKVLMLDGLVWIEGLICASFGITRLICASFGITRPIGVRVQRGADRRGTRRLREGHMDASGFLYAFADVFLLLVIFIVKSSHVGGKVQNVVDPKKAALLDDDDLLQFGSDVEDLEEDFVVQENLCEDMKDDTTNNKFSMVEDDERTTGSLLVNSKSFGEYIF
ncbi:protein LTV1-like protein [Cucumis melo var. makuwa]|uniref:Protein LTV1-like protein n=1 Tax=Cucumis melo var. makuwa TaxID=1194695 RepID=A0A5D3BK07_CUCMM|nr:protein LTV1-like protein [Cucumis melo var. makuwa]TYJ99456.1 protein LTV1-like protein [Cucumis melo var. makuwa]